MGVSTAVLKRSKNRSNEYDDRKVLCKIKASIADNIVKAESKLQLMNVSNMKKK
jgi:hypothetical protein